MGTYSFVLLFAEIKFVSFAQIIYGVLQIVAAVFESSQPRIATIADEIPNVAGVMVVVGDNFGGDSRNGTPPANRTLKRGTCGRTLFFHTLGLPAFRRAFVNIGATPNATRTDNLSLFRHLHITATEAA